MEINCFPDDKKIECVIPPNFSVPYKKENLDNICDSINFWEEDNKMKEEIFHINKEIPKKLKRLEEIGKVKQCKEKEKEKKEMEEFNKDKKHKESIQLKIREKIYSKKPFKEKKNLGRKKKSSIDLGEHNKYSDDNIIRKCKHVILDNVMNYINNKIKILYPEKENKIIDEKRLLKLKQDQVKKSKAEYNKTFLNKTLKSIYSEEVSSKYTRYTPTHNKNLIESLINDRNENKRKFFNSIFNLTFMDCLNHFRESKTFEQLQGTMLLNDYLKEIKIEEKEDDDDYCTLFQFFIKNFEKIIMEKKVRKRNKKSKK